MQRINKLSALAIPRLIIPGYYSDGGNLFLQVTPGGSKSWIFRYAAGAKKREMGLGPLHTVALAAAREKAARYRAQLLEGLDPQSMRKAMLSERKAAAAPVMTFEQCAIECIKDRRAAWTNAKNAQQWENTLRDYAYPQIRALDVAAVDTAGVRRCIDPIWETKTETATRVRQRIEAVLDWAKVHGHRTGDNPAAWKGHLQGVMAAPRKVTAVEHHTALEIDALPAFMADVRLKEGRAARALEFLILTAARTSEVTCACWAEIDFKAEVWAVPAERMKAKKEHTVPLSPNALAILLQAKKDAQDSKWLFPSKRKDAGLSNAAMSELVKGMGTTDAAGRPITVHGFRSTFRQWAAERTTYPREIAEHALAHQLADKTEAAYQRGSQLARRRPLMVDWAEFCGN